MQIILFGRGSAINASNLAGSTYRYGRWGVGSHLGEQSRQSNFGPAIGLVALDVYPSLLCAGKVRYCRDARYRATVATVSGRVAQAWG